MKSWIVGLAVCLAFSISLAKGKKGESPSLRPFLSYSEFQSLTTAEKKSYIKDVRTFVRSVASGRSYFAKNAKESKDQDSAIQASETGTSAVAARAPAAALGPRASICMKDKLGKLQSVSANELSSILEADIRSCTEFTEIVWTREQKETLGPKSGDRWSDSDIQKYLNAKVAKPSDYRGKYQGSSIPILLELKETILNRRAQMEREGQGEQWRDLLYDLNNVLNEFDQHRPETSYEKAKIDAAIGEVKALNAEVERQSQTNRSKPTLTLRGKKSVAPRVVELGPRTLSNHDSAKGSPAGRSEANMKAGSTSQPLIGPRMASEGDPGPSAGASSIEPRVVPIKPQLCWSSGFVVERLAKGGECPRVKALPKEAQWGNEEHFKDFRCQSENEVICNPMLVGYLPDCSYSSRILDWLSLEPLERAKCPLKPRCVSEIYPNTTEKCLKLPFGQGSEATALSVFESSIFKHLKETPEAFYNKQMTAILAFCNQSGRESSERIVKICESSKRSFEEIRNQQFGGAKADTAYDSNTAPLDKFKSRGGETRSDR